MKWRVLILFLLLACQKTGYWYNVTAVCHNPPDTFSIPIGYNWDVGKEFVILDFKEKFPDVCADTIWAIRDY